MTVYQIRRAFFNLRDHEIVVASLHSPVPSCSQRSTFSYVKFPYYRSIVFVCVTLRGLLEIVWRLLDRLFPVDKGFLGGFAVEVIVISVLEEW